MAKQTKSTVSSRDSKKKKAIVLKSLKNKAKTTVHEVKLKGQGKSKKTIQQKNNVKPLQQPKLVATKKKQAEPQTQVEKAPAAKASSSPIASLISQELLTPNAKILRPFREAAKRNKLRLKKLESKSKAKSTFLAKPSKTAKKYRADLRIHSPATFGFFTMGGVEPVPALVRLAKAKDLDLMAVTDYYSTECLDLIQQVAKETSVTVIPGFDLCCKVGNCSEVFMIALFPESYTSLELNRVLLELQVPSSARGRREYCLLQDISQVIEIVERHGGIIIPSRLDKTPYRQLAIPHLIEQYGFHAFDLVSTENLDYFKERWPEGGFTFFGFSNAYSLGQVGSREQQVKLEDKTFAAIKDIVARRTV